jgi:hypothetical protein
MSKISKVENYSKELTEQIVATYKAAETDEARAASLETMSAETGKTVRSLRMKLVKEGVYQKPVYVSKAGTKVETKAAIVESIASVFGVTSEQLQGLDKATKSALNLIRSKYLEAVKPE